MIRVVYSNRADVLAGALADALPPPGDPFEVPWVVAPTRALARYLAIEIAAKRGITGYTALSLRAALARAFTRTARTANDTVVIESGHVAAELFALLGDGALLESEPLAPLRGYLLAAGRQGDAVDRRRLQLARSLASTYEEYALWRPEILRAWSQDAPASDLVRRHLEPAERRLWRALYDEGGRFAARGAMEGRRYQRLENLFDGDDDGHGDGDGRYDGRDDRRDVGPRLHDETPTGLHVFGVSEWPRPYQRGLSLLAESCPVTLYALNPCREFWEDVVPVARGRARRGGTVGPEQLDLSAPNDPFRLAEAADPSTDGALLRAWGRPGREAIRLLNHLCECNFEGRFEDPETSGTRGLLAHAQRDLLERAPERIRGAGGQGPRAESEDESVVIIGAPDPRRELETIATEIWTLVATSSMRSTPLSFSDIAVVVPDGTQKDAGPSYLTLARAVFDEARGLPHAIVDSSLGGASPMVAGVDALLSLPLGAFSRREVLDVITHPNVRARFPKSDPALSIALCESLGISRGGDRNDHEGTYIDGDQFNWDQGLKRLALGVFARGPRGGDSRPVRIGGARGEAADGEDAATGYVPAELAPDQLEAAMAMAMLVRSLIADARFARTARLSIQDWVGFFATMFEVYLAPVSADDEAARRRIVGALSTVAEQGPNGPNGPSGPGGPGGVEISFAVAATRVREAIEALRIERGQTFGSGVVVGTLAALRAVPFRVLFVAGLGADVFPAPDRVAPLDLRGGRRRPGEVTRRERDRYLFLEAVLSARERLYLSHVDRSPLTGERCEASPVVQELLESLAGREGWRELERRLRRTVVWDRDADPRARQIFPSAEAEAQARVLGDDLAQRVPEVARLPASAVLHALSSEARRAAQPVLGHVELVSTSEGSETAKATNATTTTSSTMTSMSATTIAAAATGARASSSERGIRTLTLGDLRRFLECPLQGSARVVLELRDIADDADARETEHEPCELPRTASRALLADAFAAAWSGGDVPDDARLAAAYRTGIARHRDAGRLPAGPFRQALSRRHLDVLAQWRDALVKGAPTPPRGPARRLHLGRGEAGGAATTRIPAVVEETLPPIRLTVDLGQQVEVEIHGTTDWQLDFGGDRGTLVVATSTQKFFDYRDSLRIFLSHVAWAAAGAESDSPPTPPSADVPALTPGDLHRGAICRLANPLRTVTLARLPAADARRYLAVLAGDLLARVHDYFLPAEAVLMSREREVPLVETVEQVRTDPYFRDRLSSIYGPVPDPLEYPVPNADTAAALAERRFGLFQSLRRDSKPPARRGARG